METDPYGIISPLRPIEPISLKPSSYQQSYERKDECDRCGKPLTHSADQLGAEREYRGKYLGMFASRESGEQRHQCSACLSQQYSTSESYRMPSWDKNPMSSPPLPREQPSSPPNPVEAVIMNMPNQFWTTVASKGYDGPLSFPAQPAHNIVFNPGIETSTSLYFSDSGYASAPPVLWREHCQNPPAPVAVRGPADQEQQANDVSEKDIEMCDLGTIYSDASATMSSKERYISELVEDLVENISVGRALKDLPLDKLCSTLPSLLKAFATTLGRIGGCQPARDVMVFISKHRE